VSLTLAVTGGTGFVGRHVLALARARGHRVRALTRRPQEEAPGLHWVAGALEQPDSLATLVAGADAVLHIAGVVNAPDAAGFEAGNVAGTAAILAAAEGAGIRRFVHVSSLAAREPGLSTYGRTKADAEALVTRAALAWTMVRPPAIFGPGDTELFDMFWIAKHGVVPLPPGGRLSVIAVDDLARLLLDLAEAPETAGALYEADDGRPDGWTHRAFAHAIGTAVGRRIMPLPLPPLLLRGAALADRLVRGRGAKLTPDRVRYFCHPDWVSDPAKAPPATLWRPQEETAAALARTAAWYRAEGWL
jgi:uncharacterized protein YbjT (DUF2867 family)